MKECLLPRQTRADYCSITNYFMGPTIDSVEADLQAVLKNIQELADSQQGLPRELALVKTKIQEASMWLNASKLN